MKKPNLKIPLFVGVALLSVFLIRGQPRTGESSDTGRYMTEGDQVTFGFWALEADTGALKENDLKSISLNGGGEIYQYSSGYRAGVAIGQFVASIPPPLPPDSCDCNPGDCDDSGAEDIDDVVSKINYIFAGGSPCIPYDTCSCDANCDCRCDIDDVVYEIDHIFQGGPPPCSCSVWVEACEWPLRE